jgi:low affinity Fe/Cu permease
MVVFEKVVPMRSRYRASIFSRIASRTAHGMGHPAAFGAAFAIIVLWAISGPMFGFTDTWQLVINTGTTIITFLMVFLIQNTQNRDSIAIQLKLDELIRAVEGAHNALLDIELLSDHELDLAQKQYAELAEQARGELRNARKINRAPEIGQSSDARGA